MSRKAVDVEELVDVELEREVVNVLMLEGQTHNQVLVVLAELNEDKYGGFFGTCMRLMDPGWHVLHQLPCLDQLANFTEELDK